MGVLKKSYFLQKNAAQLEACDLPSAWQGRCDLVVANPPYVDAKSSCLQADVIQYEPYKALFAGQEGLEYIVSWSKTAQKILRRGGLWIFEMAYDHGPKLKSVFASLDFKAQGVFKDLAGHDRVAVFKKI